MRKGNKYLGVYILISIIVTMQFAILCQGDTAEQLTYKITKCRLIAEVKDDSLKTNNFNFQGDFFPERTKVSVLLNTFDTGANGDYSIGNLTKHFAYESSLLLLVFKNFLIKTYSLSYSLAFYWDDFSEYRDAFDFFLYPYIVPQTSTWQFFVSIGEAYNELYETLNTEQGYAIDSEYQFYSSNNNYVFEFWSGGNFTGIYRDVVIGSVLNTLISISYDNLFKIAINKESGIIEGFRTKGRTVGSFGQTDFEVLLDYQYELQGYHLFNIGIGPNFIVDPYIGKTISIWVGSGLIIVITLTLVTYFSIRIRKRRRILMSNSSNSI